MRHAKAAEGNVAHLCPGASTELPSQRKQMQSANSDL